jgi:chloride channel protein, CIC family
MELKPQTLLSFACIDMCGGFCVLHSHLFFNATCFSQTKNSLLKIVAGGSLLGLLILFFPPLYQEGYTSVEYLLKNESKNILKNIFLLQPEIIWSIDIFALAHALLKTLATSLTVDAGSNGCMIGSSIFTGAMLIFTFARAIN